MHEEEGLAGAEALISRGVPLFFRAEVHRDLPQRVASPLGLLVGEPVEGLRVKVQQLRNDLAAGRGQQQ